MEKNEAFEVFNSRAFVSSFGLESWVWDATIWGQAVELCLE
jgi:hypothetical protein